MVLYHILVQLIILYPSFACFKTKFQANSKQVTVYIQGFKEAYVNICFKKYVAFNVIGRLHHSNVGCFAYNDVLWRTCDRFRVLPYTAYTQNEKLEKNICQMASRYSLRDKGSRKL